MSSFSFDLVGRIARWNAEAVAGSARSALALERLLEAAHETEYYRGRLPRVGLAGIPVLELAEYFANAPRFLATVASEPVAIESPWPGEPPMTVARPWFPVTGYHVLADFDVGWFERRRLDALAAEPAALAALAKAVLDGRLRMPPLSFGAVALQRLDRETFSEAERDVFWDALGAPVYVQLRGFAGELLASECDLHDGLHVDADRAIVETRDERSSELVVTSLGNRRYPALRLATGLRATIDATLCACGSASPRLMGLAKIGARPGRAVA